ncbi:MAG: hypothetical protein RSE41_10275 [Clostridia bacterium]
MYRYCCERRMEPVLRFNLEGRLIGRFDDGVQLRNNGFDTLTVNNASRRLKPKTYKGSVWILEKDYTDELLKEKLYRANNKKKHIEPKPVLSFTLDGRFIKGYKMISDTDIEFDGFQPSNVSAAAHGKVRQHGDRIWIFENEYSEELLEQKIRKLTLDKKSKWSNKLIARYTFDGIYVDEGTIKQYTTRGFNSDQIYRCLNGTTEYHRGCKFIPIA